MASRYFHASFLARIKILLGVTRCNIHRAASVGGVQRLGNSLLKWADGKCSSFIMMAATDSIFVGASTMTLFCLSGQKIVCNINLPTRPDPPVVPSAFAPLAAWWVVAARESWSRPGKPWRRRQDLPSDLWPQAQKVGLGTWWQGSLKLLQSRLPLVAILRRFRTLRAIIVRFPDVMHFCRCLSRRTSDSADVFKFDSNSNLNLEGLRNAL